jgi:hypothetical protein
VTHTRGAADRLPDSLSLDEAYRAAFYMVLAYVRRASKPGVDVELLAQYTWSDPARWSDWQEAVRRAPEDVVGVANPDHEGLWRPRPDWPA